MAKKKFKEEFEDAVNSELAESALEEEELDDEGFEGDETDGDDGAAEDDDGEEFDLGITKEQVAETTDDFNAIYKEGIAAAKEIKEAFDDIKSVFNLGSFFK
ncbi:MAG: hypothetical protein FWG24_00040 [Eggerthellaceae bacterium]|nr:hypothetical protein [Eggerthellaceae bacterium]